MREKVINQTQEAQADTYKAALTVLVNHDSQLARFRHSIISRQGLTSPQCHKYALKQWYSKVDIFS